MRTIVLVGPPGVGKTTIVRRLSENGLRVADLDDVIQRRTGKHPSEIIRSSGEKEFREEEHRALVEALNAGFEVLAAGGGTYCFERNQVAIDSTGFSVYLHEEEEELARRIYSDELQHRASQREGAGGKKDTGPKRPVIYRNEDAEQSEPDLERTKLYVQKLVAERAPHYEKARLTVRCTGMDEQEIVREILTLVARRNVECL